MDSKEKKNKSASMSPNPYGTASPISKLLFFWLIPLLAKGFKKNLRQEDLYSVCEQDESGRLGDKLEGYWSLELERSKLSGGKPSVFRALIKISWRTFGLAAALIFINQCVFIVAQPILLRLLILTFTSKAVGVEAEWWKPYTYAGGICFTAFLHTLITQPCFYHMLHMSMKLRVAVSSLIYRKSLRLSKDAQRQTNIGQIVNLLSNDCARFDTCFTFLPYPIVAPVQLGILSYLLYGEIGLASLGGVLFVLVLLPMLYYLAKYTAAFRLQIAKRTDERGRFMNEIIGGMQIIKQYAWEIPFSQLIDKIRREEVRQIRKRGLLRGLHNAISRLSQKLVPFLTLVTFVLLGNAPMTADKVFFTMSCLHILIQVIIQFSPHAITGIGELTVAVQRIQNFLLLEEQRTNYSENRTRKSFTSGSYTPLQDSDNNNVPKSVGKRVSMADVCAKWTVNGKPTLEALTFSVEGDMLVMIVGPVGSSKTSLLQAILNELPLSSGKLNVSGGISYASQEPWIFAGNLRENILFGLPYDESRYKQTLKACALEEDLKQFPYGDMSIVGERGITLSGGQKARVNLARAVYRKSDIYLLDDPLSAVDTKVSRHLFDECIMKHLRGSLRILVTHQLQYLPQADIVLVLDQGKIFAQGTFKELTNTQFDFRSLLATSDTGDDSVTRDIVQLGLSIQGNESNVQSMKPEENKEKNMEGSVTLRTYWEYFTAGHSRFTFACLFLVFVLCQCLTSASDYFLAQWSNSEDKITSSVKSIGDTSLRESIHLYIYTVLILGVILFNLLRGLWFYIYCAKISIHLHDTMFQSVVRAPIRFFDDNPSGRVMNRFTRDIGTVDEMLPPAVIATFTIFLHILGVIGVVILSNYYLVVPTVVLFVVLYILRYVFMGTSRDVKRIESTARSPLYTHVAATIQGLTTVRAFKSQELLVKQFEQLQDTHSSSWFLFVAVNRCFGIWLELISDVFLIFVTFSFLSISSSTEGGNVGLAISSMLTMMNVIQWGMFQSAEMENHMTSVERALEYSKLTPEAHLDSEPEKKPPQGWPVLGQIEFRNVSLCYEEGKPVLKDLRFKIRPSEKIGIVGRTGAGKTSIIAALFRLTEPEGEILIDNLSVKQIGLHDLRQKISIIPQDPILFSGSIRYNLDPFDQFEDAQLWRVIEEVQLKDAVPSLDYRVADGGANFSVGQRQLVCLARAILRKNKILVMDEATANVDRVTDNLIQETIRSKFSDCTIITIAHRLHSVIYCDRVLVLETGQLKEFDHPFTLLLDKYGIFSGMVAQTGPSTCAMLKGMASEAFTLKAIMNTNSSIYI